MVDVTELWWAVHPEESRVFYLHPGLGSRAEHLRVLAWTGGGLPMIWFAVLPDAAARSDGSQAEVPDHVWNARVVARGVIGRIP